MGILFCPRLHGSGKGRAGGFDLTRPTKHFAVRSMTLRLPRGVCLAGARYLRACASPPQESQKNPCEPIFAWFRLCYHIVAATNSIGRRRIRRGNHRSAGSEFPPSASDNPFRMLDESLLERTISRSGNFRPHPRFFEERAILSTLERNVHSSYRLRLSAGSLPGVARCHR